MAPGEMMRDDTVELPVYWRVNLRFEKSFSQPISFGKPSGEAQWHHPFGELWEKRTASKPIGEDPIVLHASSRDGLIVELVEQESL